jgi:hypothetical protein
MAGDDHSAQRDLTGVWQGLYVYPWGRSEGFVATLVQSGDHIGGTTHETATQGRAKGKTLYAIVDGTRSGSAVTFRKTYDGSGGWTHTVFYSGQLSADGAEIDGEWRIPPFPPGRFLMIRQGGKEEVVTRRVAVDVEI